MKTLMLNQKSSMTYEDIKTYVTKTKSYQNKFIIFPSSIYVSYLVKNGFNTGIQNIATSNAGNQTGEITAKQAVGIGSRYVIIGHSERRTNQNEGSDILINKINEAVENKLNIVYCVGENLVDYKLGNSEKFVVNELVDVLSNVKIPDDLDLYVAYEPIWAIGSGLTPTNNEIKKMSTSIRKYLNDNNYKDAKILYGGSVNNENIESLIEVDEVDGFLIGGASCNFEKTIDICEKTMNSTK